MVEISIIVPSHNSQDTIKKTLESIFANDYPKSKYEVIVVDSSDQDLSYLKKKFPIRFIKVKPSIGRIANVQRNIGAKAAKGKFVLYGDSDCIVPKNWIKSIVGQFDGKDVAVVGGGVTTEGNIYDLYMENSVKPATRLIKTAFCTTAHNFYKRKWPIGANQAYTKKILKLTNGFDETIESCEETDLLWRIVEKGFKIISIPNVTVKHTYNKNFFQIFDTYFRYGYGCGYFCMKYPNSSFSQKRIFLLTSILIFYFLLAAAILKFQYFSPLFAIPLLLLFLYYIRLIPKIGYGTLLFPFFDIFFAGISYIAGMIMSIFLYPFKRWG